MPTNSESGKSLRIDRWLWRARFYKTRALAQQSAEKGRIRVNGRRIEKAGARIRPGDIMTLAPAKSVLIIRVLDLGTTRGPAKTAQTLYEIIDDA